MHRKNRIGMHVEKNAFIDAGEGVITFPGGQIITDGTQQRNGTKYDIETMDISEYKGQITADHVDEIQSVIGKTIGLAKSMTDVTISGIQFAVKENALARLTYDLMKGGYPLDLSIETYGPWPDESDDTYYKAKLVGLSVVVVGNNRSASMNHAEVRQLVHNSLAHAKQDGLDISEAEKLFQELESKPNSPEKVVQELPNNEEHKMFKTIKNSRTFPVTVKYKNGAGEEVVATLEPGKSIDVPEAEAAGVETLIAGAPEPKAENGLTKDDLKGFLGEVKELVEATVKPVADQVNSLDQRMLDGGAKAPEFKKDPNAKPVKNGIRDEHKELAAMDWEDRTVKQIESARQYLVNRSLDGLQQLDQINKFHMQQLQEKGIVKNGVDLTAFGNFVTSPELLTEIEGTRSDYSPLVSAVGFKETLALKMSWLERNGDIEMDEVGMEDAGDDENLKPVSDYDATPRSADLKEVAAVTPIANSATRFLAVDLLGDVAEGYRTSYQRKLAQIVIARLQQAINYTGNSVPLNLSSAVNGLISMVRAIQKVANVSPNGTFIMNTSSELELFAIQMQANLTGDTLGLFSKGPDGNMRFVGRNYIVVPDDAMPTINTNQTKTFVVDGANVTIDQGIMYADLKTVSGRVSGGLNYSLSTEAAYEVGGVVKSAYQRDELLLRGFFYRNAAVRNRAKVAGIHAGGIS